MPNPIHFCLVFGEAAIRPLFRQITENVAESGGKKEEKNEHNRLGRLT